MTLKRGDIETSLEVRCLDASISLEEYQRLPKNPLYLILDNLRSAFNVGAIFRTCDLLRVEGLLLCGYTAFPPHVKLQKTSLGTIDFVPWQRFERTLDAVQFLHDKGVEVWAAETTSVSVPYTTAPYPPRVGIVFGNEALGVDADVLKACDRVIEIPVYGFKNSLNVASACAVIGYRAVESMLERAKKETEVPPQGT